MKQILALMFACSLGAAAQHVTVNPAEAKWEHEKKDPAGAESVTLREDPRTGGLELLVRYPAGHVFKPHWHSSNERLILIEGQLSIQLGDSKTILQPGGYAYLPARQVQTMSCVSKTRCGFYVHWDGPLDIHPPPVR